jgi:hypothetical protein
MREDVSGKKELIHGPTVLEEVIDKATARSELEREIKGEPVTLISMFVPTPTYWLRQSSLVQSVPTTDMLLYAP